MINCYFCKEKEGAEAPSKLNKSNNLYYRREECFTTVFNPGGVAYDLL